MPTIINLGEDIVFGVQEMKPIRPCPFGRVRVRMRPEEIATAFVKDGHGITRHLIHDHGDRWSLSEPQARNFTVPREKGSSSGSSPKRAAVVALPSVERERGWTPVSLKLPPGGAAVETKIDDADGIRHFRILYRQGSVWFLPDGSSYVYYEPTHWRMLP